MQRQLGIKGQVFYMFDPTDTTALAHERSYLACFRSLSRFKLAFYGRANVPTELEEAL